MHELTDIIVQRRLEAVHPDGSRTEVAPALGAECTFQAGTAAPRAPGTAPRMSGRIFYGAAAVVTYAGPWSVRSLYPTDGSGLTSRSGRANATEISRTPRRGDGSRGERSRL
jgi:hypothetical protein